ncbi:hypothetical protein H310_09292 [Aphanomyces invadans]|uniref:Uncharacterized protein n=1 Tax=Aphanomyces invadans TaxID=157072 RepID=A0A024TVE4_9STRA|nr:hypothetical protein H310_09292 [Aphanomyces invadans]ETV97988.1 hypothetical protein H310_09292 [Aphanomyces invadans]|eukprot:XP_008873549.1 hypothetical protein H310_09292 [Aphanomyces invadans]
MRLAWGMCVASVSAAVVKDKRYCELLFVQPPVGGSAVADVFSTFGLNACPASVWNAITPINARDSASIAVVLNGPRYWTMDEFGPLSTSVVKDRVVKTVQGLNVTLLGRVSLPWPLPTGSSGFYKPSAVTRNADFVWRAGSTAFYLTNEESGERYIMQSYSQQVHPSLTFASLPALRFRELPPRWSFSAVVLPTDVNVTTPALVGGAASVGLVLQDEFGNSYSYAGNVDAYLARMNQCTEVSIVGDATYCIPTIPTICSGSGPSPTGTACPSKGDVAVKDCWPHLPSFASVHCVAPRDTTCRFMPSGAWGCVWT